MLMAQVRAPWAQIYCARSADLDEGVGHRVGGGCGSLVSLDFHDAVAAHIANESLDGPT
jgi:hypothetical protein